MEMVLNVSEFYPGYKMPERNDKRQNDVFINNVHDSKTDKTQKNNSVFNQDSKKPVDLKIQSDIHAVKNTFDSVKNVTTDIDRLDSSSKSNYKITLTALSPIIPLRRISSLPDTLEKGDYIRAGGLLSLAAINTPQDFIDLKDGAIQAEKILERNLPNTAKSLKEFGNLVKPLIKKVVPSQTVSAIKNIALSQTEGISSYNTKAYQHEFSFFRNTFLQPLATKYKWLNNFDNSLESTKVGGFIKKVLNIESHKVASTGQKYLNLPIMAYEVQGGNAFTRLVGRAMLRIPALSVLALGLLELPAVIKSAGKEGNFFDKAKAVTAQVIKSAGYVGLVTAGIGICGAAMAGGALTALAGMAIGSAVGAMASSQLNKLVDKVIPQTN
ncbi:MAG TPA: hypothetical protein P5556_08580 [Candidatus Gastranaerophilales bacterium]|nr:hypothetical protein [Candidatus Gastranaerophilales bacterium]